jgi:hypothetical protein
MTGLTERSEREVWYPIRAAALDLAGEAKLDRRALDVLDAYEHAERLAPLAKGLLGRAIELLDHVVSTCGLTTGKRPPPALSFELALDTAVRAAFDVGDLAQLIRVEFRGRDARLTSSRRSAPMVVLTEADRAITGVDKAMCALDLAAARASNTPGLRDFRFELDRSLSARRAYARLSRQVLHALVPGAHAPRFRFRGALQAIDELVAQDAYDELRIADRLLLRAAQRQKAARAVVLARVGRPRAGACDGRDQPAAATAGRGPGARQLQARADRPRLGAATRKLGPR